MRHGIHTALVSGMKQAFYPNMYQVAVLGGVVSQVYPKVYRSYGEALATVYRYNAMGLNAIVVRFT